MFRWLRLWNLFSSRSEKKPEATKAPPAEAPPAPAAQRPLPPRQPVAVDKPGPADPERTFAAALKRLEDRSANVREAAIEPLVRAGAAVVGPLIKRLTHNDSGVRQATATIPHRPGSCARRLAGAADRFR